MKLSIVIVSYNVKYHLEQCLRSLRRATALIESEVWVVDNASTDDSYHYLWARFPVFFNDAVKLPLIISSVHAPYYNTYAEKKLSLS